MLLYPVGTGESCRHACQLLKKCGISMTDHPSPEITHLLLDIPSQHTDMDLKELLRRLPGTLTIIGGNLNPEFRSAYRVVDLLKDPFYLAGNAAITAECALQAAAPHIQTTFADTPALILGWGRIGKCLVKLLSAIGCPITVAARKEDDRAMLEALGYKAVDFSQIQDALQHCRILFNTVPCLNLQSSFPDPWRDGIVIDLASSPGLMVNGAIPARGLPGKFAPESSGKLIAQTILRFCKEGIL